MMSTTPLAGTIQAIAAEKKRSLLHRTGMYPNIDAVFLTPVDHP